MKWINTETLKQQDFQDYSPSDVMQAIDDCPAVDIEELITKLCNIFSSGKSTDVSELIQPQKPYADSTLWNMCKKDLIQYIRELEYNRNVATARLQQQAENMKDWKPEVHAHWETKEQKVNAYEGTYIVYYAICSKCGGRITYGSFPPEYANKEKVSEIINRRYKYCPRCGAKMDGE